MQFEMPARTILCSHQNHQDTPSEIRDLYKSISMPDSQPLFVLVLHIHISYFHGHDSFIWADRIKSRPLPPNLAWKSFTHQLQPELMWGIATVVMSPHRLLIQFQRVYFRCLLLLNVNCHVDLLWRLILIFPIQLGIQSSSFQRINDGKQILYD